MNEKMPYYMAYPVPLSFDDERTERLDFEYLKSMYPDLPKRLLPYVEEECDRMEYENSMIYDQYPDKLQLRLMCRRVYDNVRKHERFLIPGAGRHQGDRCRTCFQDEPELFEMPSLRDLIEVLVFQELYRRRCDHRRRNRRIY